MMLDCCYSLPERPGVYYFYDSNNVLLYIGKSVNIRKRVLSHFYKPDETRFHLDMIKQVAAIEYKCTAGELGALLLESAEIKRLYPLYNKRLRQLKHLYSWILNSEYKPELKLIDDILDEQISVGLYRSAHRAKQWLKNLIAQYQLCSKVIGLEKTTRNCFNYQLRRCLGACCGQEPIDTHNHRLLKAFEDFSLISWSWKGAIAILEEDYLYNIKQWHIINNWRYMTTVESLDSVVNEPLPPFSRDAYLILINFLRYNNPEIIDLASHGSILSQ
ncbi:GIY-YIG nuclease family protein [Entomomonas asaccharolytica]|uniref:Excinuclease cho n=1 Tax=Entomomonas asaccharolytica TaxID=2785331 RepID=A0A974NHY2_9GAMM|nr:GIY-YIG nuclease family protein [Entomomonas asaccharolytica]QQP86799.1 GIY-YIG nuclease family protein [Entomomonas asaccharolytica]